MYGRWYTPRQMLRKIWRNSAAVSVLLSAITAFSAARHKPAKPSNAPLAAQLDAILADPAVAGSGWGVSVVSMDGTVLYGHNDGERFAAASNTKLLTTGGRQHGPR